MRIPMLSVAVCAFFAAVLVAGPDDANARVRRGGGATTGEGCLPGVLKSRLAQVRKRFGSINVVSTHRPGARINGSGKPSYHGSCRAVDFVPPSGKYKAVTVWLYANHEGGVGTYTCMNHIHLDNGPNVRWSKCR